MSTLVTFPANVFEFVNPLGNSSKRRFYLAVSLIGLLCLPQGREHALDYLRIIHVEVLHHGLVKILEESILVYLI